MGLAETRRMKALQEVSLPERVKEIAEVCGAPIPYQVDWASLADNAGVARHLSGRDAVLEMRVLEKNL